MLTTNLKMDLGVRLFAVLALACSGRSQGLGEDAGTHCPKLYPKLFVGYTPIGNLTAGNYTERPKLQSLRACIAECCQSESCHVVLAVEDKCYHIECYSDGLCMPLRRTDPAAAQAKMILVKPVLANENWNNLLSNYRDERISSLAAAAALEDEQVLFPEGASHLRRGDFLDALAGEEDEADLVLEPDSLQRLLRPQRPDYVDQDLVLPAYIGKVCEIGGDDCPPHALCSPVRAASRRGICECADGYKGDGRGGCAAMFSKDSVESEGEVEAEGAESRVYSAEERVRKLTVSIESKEIQLPENTVTLSAYVIPDEKTTGAHYSYVWTRIDQPRGVLTGTMKQNGATATLTELAEGHYSFRVSVNGTAWYGEGAANVTVLPARRTNTAPVAVVTPPAQTVRLPNSVAVLDGGASKDDDKIISWRWEVAAGPIGYQPPLPEGQTLMVSDLTTPGNYTFKLTVEDSDHVKNSTTANVTVLNHTDYPPEANAGQDQIVYLPQNSLTLNGSLSSDDREITSWEWTKAASDESKAVDMQNTHSPYLQLSNLSEGVYTFNLKVTDSSGQSSSAEVHIFVKPPTNTPPVADAGPDQYITLPQTWAVLNGTSSHDDQRIVSYNWRLVSGPSNGTIVGQNGTVANATGLTKGEYVFRLTVLDDNGNSAIDNMTVHVVQTKNKPPVADGGGDQVLTLPLPLLQLNGSRSSDDFRIVAWRWRRAGQSVAAGTVVPGSDTRPVLMLTDIVPGRYVFELTVTDDQEASSTDTVSIQVKPSPLEDHLLEMTLNEPIASFTESQLSALVRNLSGVLPGGVRVNVTAVRRELDTDNTQILLFLHEQDAIVGGERALSLVRRAGWGARGAGGSVVRLQTVRCLSACSGRGVCDQAARACRCDAFWMQDVFSQLDRDSTPNCDWSVVYASVGGVALLATVAAAGWGAGRCARRLFAAVRRPAPPRTKYRLLPAGNHEDVPFTNDASDTETDSDVLFETRSRESSFSSRLLNGDGPPHSARNSNGHSKPSRKVKA